MKKTFFDPNTHREPRSFGDWQAVIEEANAERRYLRSDDNSYYSGKYELWGTDLSGRVLTKRQAQEVLAKFCGNKDSQNTWAIFGVIVEITNEAARIYFPNYSVYTVEFIKAEIIDGVPYINLKRKSEPKKESIKVASVVLPPLPSDPKPLLPIARALGDKFWESRASL